MYIRISEINNIGLKYYKKYELNIFLACNMLPKYVDLVITY